jgi:hypothetical protein
MTERSTMTYGRAMLSLIGLMSLTSLTGCTDRQDTPVRPPQAPEFADIDQWLNSTPLRGYAGRSTPYRARLDDAEAPRLVSDFI